MFLFFWSCCSLSRDQSPHVVSLVKIWYETFTAVTSAGFCDSFLLKYLVFSLKTSVSFICGMLSIIHLLVIGKTAAWLELIIFQITKLRLWPWKHLILIQIVYTLLRGAWFALNNHAYESFIQLFRPEMILLLWSLSVLSVIWLMVSSVSD